MLFCRADAFKQRNKNDPIALLFNMNHLQDTGECLVKETSILKQCVPGQEPKVERRERTLPRPPYSDDSSGGGTRTCSMVVADDLDLSFSASPKLIHTATTGTVLCVQEANRVNELDMTSRTPSPRDTDLEYNKRNSTSHLGGQGTAVNLRLDSTGTIERKHRKRRPILLVLGIMVTLTILWGIILILFKRYSTGTDPGTILSCSPSREPEQPGREYFTPDLEERPVGYEINRVGTIWLSFINVRPVL